MEQYKKDMKQFEKDMIEIYEHGKHLFLKYCNGKIGGGETAYMHTLQFYVPTLAACARDKLKVSLGVFNKQGVEAPNIELKFIWDHGTNGWKQQRCKQVMNKLNNIFKC